MLIALAAMAAIVLLPVAAIFPVMIVLGPLTVLQYLYWSHKQGEERATWHYLWPEIEVFAEARSDLYQVLMQFRPCA